MTIKKRPEPEVIKDNYFYLNRYFRRWRGPSNRRFAGRFYRVFPDEMNRPV